MARKILVQLFQYWFFTSYELQEIRLVRFNQIEEKIHFRPEVDVVSSKGFLFFKAYFYTSLCKTQGGITQHIIFNKLLETK